MKYLKTKNGEYAEQVSQLSSTVENIQRMSSLKDEMDAKKILIDEITENMRDKKISLEDETAKNVQHSKAESDGPKVDVLQLVTSNEEYNKQIAILKDKLATKTTMDVQTWCTTCKEMVAKNATVNEQLDFTKAESDGLKAVIKDIQSKNTIFFSELENLVSFLQEMVELNDTLQAENDALDEQLNLYKAESDGLKEALQDLKSKKPNHDSELENLKSSLQEMVELNGKLQAQIEQVSTANEELGRLNKDNEEKNSELLHVVECLRKSLNDERSIHEKEIEEMQKMVEMVTKMSDQFVQLACWGMTPKRTRHML